MCRLNRNRVSVGARHGVCLVSLGPMNGTCPLGAEAPRLGLHCRGRKDLVTGIEGCGQVGRKGLKNLKYLKSWRAREPFPTRPERGQGDESSPPPVLPPSLSSHYPSWTSDLSGRDNVGNNHDLPQGPAGSMLLGALFSLRSPTARFLSSTSLENHLGSNPYLGLLSHTI